MASATRERRNLPAIALAAVAALALLIAPAAFADALGDAKSAGYVGERTDGQLGLVTSAATADVKELVKSVNARRKEQYAAIAQKNGTTVEAVAALAGRKAIEMTAPGNYIQNASGAWVKK
jgi:uncharacterized protein YdbL (DUF1318 family)